MIISEHKQASVNRKGTSWKTFLGYYNLVLLFIIITLGSIVLTPWLTLCINGNNKVGRIKSFCWFNYKFKKFKIIHAPKSSVSFHVFHSWTHNALWSTLAKMADQLVPRKMFFHKLSIENTKHVYSLPATSDW